jgi:hypothetical protein
MLYLFNVVMGKGEIEDPEGSEFSSLDDARAEAKQIARDLAAEELRQGRPVEADWRVDVTDQFGSVQAVVMFQSILLKPRLRLVYPKQAAAEATATSGDMAFTDQYHRVQALRHEMRAITGNIRATYQEIRAQLAQL